MDYKVSKNTFFRKNCQCVVLLDDLSIEKIIKQKLLGSLILWNQNENLQQDKSFQFKLEKISLYRLKHYKNVVYRCGIALALASNRQLDAGEIAATLVDLLLAMQEKDLDAQRNLTFTLAVVESGWIDWQLDDRQLAIWLDRLTLRIQPIANSENNSKNSQSQQVNLFPIQYAHARCCSLLRLANERNLIEIRDLSFSQSIGQWLEPIPIPWLDSDNFQLIHPVERHLIDRIIIVVDALESLAAIDWVKLSSSLGLAFLDLDRFERIFGEVEQQTPQLAKARLGLIAIAQFLLFEILREKLGVEAVVEL